MNNVNFFETLKQSKSGLEYLQIIEKGKSRKLEKERGFEFHHVFPRALGGKDEDGIVKLSYFEHIKAHVLLAKAIPCRETLGAVAAMFRGQWKKLSEIEQLGIEELQKTARLREQIQEYCRQLRIEQCLNPENRKKAKETKIKKYGSVNATLMTPEAREKVKQKLIQKYGSTTGAMNTPSVKEKAKKTSLITYEYRRGVIQSQEFQTWYKHRINDFKKIIQAVPVFLRETEKKLTDYPRVPSPGPYIRKGIPRGAKKGNPSHHKGCKASEETRQKMRESHQGFIWISRDGNTKLIKSFDFEQYSKQGWKRGRK